MNSNFTLRFPRTSREAYGHDVRIGDDSNPDRIVGWAVAFGAVFMLGFLLGAAA